MAVVTQLNHKKELRSVPPPKLPSIVDIKNAIPAHCFTKNTFTSVRYLIQDLLLMAALYLILSPVERYFGWVGLFAWYWAYGFVGFALFLIGHDTGHSSFSDYEWLNDICGHIAHAPLLVPYWPWQKSHRQHHQFTSHLEKDRGHAWITEKKYNRSWLKRSFAAFPLSGWLIFTPLYTVFGWPDGSHYWPFSRLFDNNIERLKCAFSATCCLICGYTAYALLGYSVYNWFKYYYIPISFQGFVLFMVTYLQHRDVDIEAYEPEEWQFVRGQTQTIDRKYGFGLDTLMHHVTDGHVAHHFFFTKIPHYHLIDATEGIKKVLKPYENTPYGYKSDSNYDFFFKFLHYRAKLDYLINKSKGVLQHRVGVEGERAARKNY